MLKNGVSFGFIQQDGEEADMFVLPANCAYDVLPPQGTRLRYSVVIDAKSGRPRAEYVWPEDDLAAATWWSYAKGQQEIMEVCADFANLSPAMWRPSPSPMNVASDDVLKGSPFAVTPRVQARRNVKNSKSRSSQDRSRPYPECFTF